MRRSRGWNGRIFGLAMSLCGTVWLAQPAAAQTKMLIGSFVQADGLTFTVTGCTLNGVAETATGTNANVCAGLAMLSSTGRGAHVEVESATTGAAIFSLASSTQSLTYTLNITPTVTGTTPPITSLATTANLGTGTSIPGTTTGETLTDYVCKGAGLTCAAGLASTISSQNINLASNTLTTATNFAANDPLSVTTSVSLAPSPGSSLTLSNVMQIYSPAPEPIALSLFTVGLAGLAAARLRRSRGLQAAA